MARRAQLALGLLAISLVGQGCSDKAAEADGNAKRAAASSVDDATSPVHDEAYRFELARPGPGWKLLHEADASKLAPDALAGALSEGNVTGLVLVSRTPPTPLEQLGQQRISRLPLADKQVERHAAESFAGKDARHFVVTGKVAGVGLRYASKLLVNKTWVYQLLAWAPLDDMSADGSAFAPFFEAFSLLEGEVAGRNKPRPTADCRGIGWRVKDGIFESAVSRLRVKPAAGWRLAVGSELAFLNPQADVGLVATDSAGSIVLVAEQVPAANQQRLAAELRRNVAAKLKAPGEPQRHRAELAGRPLSFERHRAGSFVYDHAVLFDGDLCFQVMARGPAPAGDDSQTTLAAALEAIELLDGEKAAALAKELADQVDIQTAVGKAFSIRGRTFRDFERDIAWTSPSGDWKMSAAADARAVNPDALLYLDNRRAGLHGLFIAEPANELDVATYHARVVERMQALVTFTPQTTKTTIGDLEAKASEGAALVVGDSLRYRVTTTVRGPMALQALVWGTPEAMTVHAKEAGSVAGGLELQGGLTAVAATTDAYRDHRLGFEMKLPPRWQFRDLTPPELADSGRLVRWELEGRWIGVAAACLLDTGQDEQWLLSFLEQLLRDQYGPIARGAPAETETALAGKTARHVHWTAVMQRIDVLLVSQGNLFYALVAVDRSDGALNEASRGFSLLP